VNSQHYGTTKEKENVDSTASVWETVGEKASTSIWGAEGGRAGRKPGRAGIGRLVMKRKYYVNIKAFIQKG